MRVVSIASFKGGTAKTSTILHLGANLALFHGQRVLLVDFDAQANLTSGLGFDCDSIDSMAAVLQGQKEIGQVIQGTKVPGLDLIAADTWLERIELTSPLAADRYSHERLKHLICSLDYDWILIDTPPSLSWLTESALIAAHFVIVSATAEFYSVKGSTFTVALPASLYDKDVWYIDSRASCHMTNREEWFKSLQPYNSDKSVELGDKYSLEIKGVGTIAIKNKRQGQKNWKCTFGTWFKNELTACLPTQERGVRHCI